MRPPCTGRSPVCSARSRASTLVGRGLAHAPPPRPPRPRSRPAGNAPARPGWPRQIAGSTEKPSVMAVSADRRLLEVAGRGRLVAADRQHQREHPRPERQPEGLAGGPHAGVDADAVSNRCAGRRPRLASGSIASGNTWHPGVADADQRHRARRPRPPAPTAPSRRAGRRGRSTSDDATYPVLLADPAPERRPRRGQQQRRPDEADEEDRGGTGPVEHVLAQRSRRPRACNPSPAPASRRWSAAAGSHGHRPRSAAGRAACRARAAPRRSARAGCRRRHRRRRSR